MALNLDSLGLSAKVTAEGISAPDYQTILSTLIVSVKPMPSVTPDPCRLN